MGATLASSVLGFGREIVNARFFGTTPQLDAFLAAAVIPTILFGVFNGALVNALVPVFSEYWNPDDQTEFRRLTSTVFNIVLIGLSVSAFLGWVLAPLYVPLIAHGFPQAQMETTVRMTRWLMPSVLATSLAGVVAALLNAQNRFSATAIQGIAANVVTIGVVVWLNPRLGIFALVLGTALGLAAQLLVQLPSVLLRGTYRPVIDLGHPGLTRIMLMLGPIVVGSAAGQTAIFFDRFFASTLSPGYLSGMNYATRLVGFPQQIFAAAIATVIFPLFASQFASANLAGVRRSVVMGLRMVNLFTIPSVVVLIMLARPIVAALFQGGAFKSTATDLCAGLLPFAASGLVGTAASIVLTRCSFACKETRWTVGISIFAVVLNVALSVYWLPTLGARGLLLANGISQWVQAAAFFVLVWKLVGGLDWKPIAVSTFKIVLCALATALALDWVASLHVHTDPSLASRAWYLTGQLFIAAMAFIGTAQLLGVEELRIAVQLIVAKFASRTPMAPVDAQAPIA
ncbi:MAG: murein biosynthesis integral membrane protein MurJ [Candidatus Eremiobacteraeota bacterium]|nr:murein biosynthesis integral membrane protein MurJ [Candidatus Eremiobacteraeota bacterium]